MHRSLTRMLGISVILLLVFASVAMASNGNPPKKQDITSPQPLSNADQNSGGANGQCPGGPYCSTRDGSPSQNGNENGNANGKPCAGCVGKADNKNPQGQMPGGSDGNNGYECDGNNGIGKSNPAHTKCHEGSPTPTPSPTSQPTPAPSPSPTPTPAPTPTAAPTPPQTTKVVTKRVPTTAKKHKLKKHNKHHVRKHHKHPKHHKKHKPVVIHPRNTL